jgi:hypothetical protein
MRHLPDDVQEIVGDQGWNDETVIIHLMGYIRACKVKDALADYFQECADEENSSSKGDRP